MAFTHEPEAPSCKICRDIWTAAKESHIICLPCRHAFLQSVKETNKDGGGSSGGRDESEKQLLEVGFWGGIGGKSWDDGFFDGVRAITVQFGQCICSIQVTYDKDGIPVNGEKHGYKGHDSTSVIELDYPKEYIVRVGGHAFFVDNDFITSHPFSTKKERLVITSLTFETNKRTFGPYGIAAGLPFTFPLVGMRIVGFKGRSEGYLDAIGFHVSTDTPSKMIRENLAEDAAVSAASSGE